MGIVAHRHQGGHIEGAAQVRIAGLTDAGLLMHGLSRSVFTGIQTGLGDPLANIQVRRLHRQLRQDLKGAGQG